MPDTSGARAALPALLALAALLAGAAPATRAEETDAPDLALRDLEGAERRLSDYRGCIVVLNFWATWCVPCREEMPVLAWAHRRYAERGVRVVGVSADDPAARDAVERFAREMGLEFPIWVGGTVADMERMGLGSALPATAILAPDGRIVARIRGPVTKPDLRRRIDWLLEAPPAEVGASPGGEPPAHAHPEEGHDHPEGEEHAHPEGEHTHGATGIEGASLVPS